MRRLLNRLGWWLVDATRLGQKATFVDAVRFDSGQVLQTFHLLKDRGVHSPGFLRHVYEALANFYDHGFHSDDEFSFCNRTLVATELITEDCHYVSRS